jgi:hypothetical protein
MAQIFHRSTNVISRASLVGAFVLAPVGIFAVSIGISRSPFNTSVGVPLDQPVPFSHEHHVRELGIDCRYCHTGVEKSANAGVPPTHTCMSCHSQIWTNSPLLEPIRQSYATNTPIVWNRVNKLPEFVYFNHSIHVNRGISCNICHGPVEKMMLTYKGQPFRMAWCLECHRDPASRLYDQNERPKAEGTEEKPAATADAHGMYADADRKDLTPREQVFNLFWKYQADPADLSPRERAIMEGSDYTPTSDEYATGENLVKQRHVAQKQLADCWICHR